ncbi:MAG: prepilin peptidase [Chloroflexi bacterium]|nr:prepilin peptidase [Chloroflexota bacterium]
MAFVFAFFIGTAVGSFVNVVADRLPAGQSLVRPGSHCPVCDTHLRAFDLVPVLSYVWLRARCRYCGAAIPRRLPLVEAGTGLLFALAAASFGLSAAFAAAAVVLGLLVAITIIDLEHGLILDKVVLPASVAALLMAPLWPLVGVEREFFPGFLDWPGPVESLASSLAGGVAGFVFFLAIVFLRPGGMGGGDVKLGGLLGLLLGLAGVVIAVWVAVVAGGVVAAALLVLGKRGRKSEMPFGPFLAGGAAVALLAGSQVQSWYLGA